MAQQPRLVGLVTDLIKPAFQGLNFIRPSTTVLLLLLTGRSTSGGLGRNNHLAGGQLGMANCSLNTRSNRPDNRHGGKPFAQQVFCSICAPIKHFRCALEEEKIHLGGINSPSQFGSNNPHMYIIRSIRVLITSSKLNLSTCTDC